MDDAAFSASNSRADENTSEEPTLYNPPEDDAEQIEPDEAQEEIHLDIPKDLAHRLRDVSLQLGLSPSVVASRAINMVCEEVGLVEEQEISSNTLIQKYQTRLDLLHALEHGVEQEAEEEDEDTEEFGWEAVDRIIEAAEKSE